MTVARSLFLIFKPLDLKAGRQYGISMVSSLLVMGQLFSTNTHPILLLCNL